jgi:hypothetical protein
VSIAIPFISLLPVLVVEPDWASAGIATTAKTPTMERTTRLISCFLPSYVAQGQRLESRLPHFGRVDRIGPASAEADTSKPHAAEGVADPPR